MILSDKTLMKMLYEHTLIVDPLEIGQIQPASIDIRIGNTYSIVEDSSSGIINLDDEISYKQITAEKYILLPGQFVPATTMEYFELPDNLTAFVEGRRVGQLVFAQLDKNALHPYRGKYQGQRGATGSKAFLDNVTGLPAVPPTV